MVQIGDKEIIVEDVHKYFGSKHVLKGISFHLPAEENLAIVGPNGSGKTTLLRILASIYLPDKGSVHIGSYNLVKQTQHIRGLLSYVSPNLSFHKKLTLRETLDYFADLQGVSWKKQKALLDDVDLSKMLHTPIEGFSEGQKAMTRLMIALLKDPQILILDEVTATLDTKKKESVIKYIHELNQEREITTLLIDHDPGVIDRLCNKILMITSGKVMKFGETRDIIKQIPYTFDVKVVPHPSINVSEFVKDIGFSHRIMGEMVQFYAKTKKVVDEIIEELLNRPKGEILEFIVSGLSMEDIYWHWLLLLDIPIENGTKELEFS